MPVDDEREDGIVVPGQKARRHVAIVPHTHWDREWYSPYQTFRLRLVDTLDAFLPALEADPSYTRFLLDGQMAVVDDYLAVRPEAEARLRRLALSGRLDMGPWYTLMDEFLVSGETIVRDLQLGLDRALAFGGAMPVGYLPDMFGHVAQMPQLLRLAGIQHAVVWRGVPAAIDRSAFWWCAPDGSTVRAEYLVASYSNGAGVVDDAKALVGRLRALEAEVGHFLLDGMLVMNGTDHQEPQPWLGRVVAEANSIQDDYRISITSLAEYLVAAPTEGLPTWAGELRSGARANLLMGVASNRVDVKQAAARAERALERLAEPLCALFTTPDAWPSALLDEAWRNVVLNAAHDSVCACSIDEVCDAVLHRYAEARHIGEGLADRALDTLAASMAHDGWVVVNMAARTRGGVVEVDVPGEGLVPGAQVLSERGPVLSDVTMDAAQAAVLLGEIRSQQLGRRTFVNRVDVDHSDDGLLVTLHAHSRLLTTLLMSEVMGDAVARVREHPEIPVRVLIQREPSRRVLVRVDDVPGFGWRMLGEVSEPAPAVRPVGVAGLANGVVTVEVDTDDGTFAVDGRTGYDRLVDGGDAGDTYNYSPPAHDHEIDHPDSVSVERLEAGPVRGVLRVLRTYRWPERVVDGGRQGERIVAVETTIELRAGESLVRVTTAFDNACRDHRLRAHFPLPAPATSSRAECAFGIVERGLDAEGGPNERGIPTFPSRRFVQADRLTVVHEGLLEYEVVDDGRALALTLLRATGMLSGVALAYRPLPAGPPIPVEGAQVAGRHGLRYGLSVAPDADPYALVDDVFVPLAVRTTSGGGMCARTGAALVVDGAEVSALRRVAAGTELRVFNPSDAPAVVRVDDRRGWVVDLRGAPEAPFDGTLELRPWGIVTLLLADP